MIEWSQAVTGKCRRIADVPKGAEIEYVNGRENVGNCEVCGGPILVGQRHYHDSEGTMWHERCTRYPYRLQDRKETAR